MVPTFIVRCLFICRSEVGYAPSPRAANGGFTCFNRSTGAVAAVCGYRLIAETKCQGGLNLAAGCNPGGVTGGPNPTSAPGNGTFVIKTMRSPLTDLHQTLTESRTLVLLLW